MAWVDEVSKHEQKIRRHSFYVGVTIGVVLCIASGFIIDYIIDVLKHT